MNKKELQCFLQYHIHSFIYLFIHSLLQTFIHSFIHSFIHFLGSGPKGVDDLSFHTGEFSPSSSALTPPHLQVHISALRPKSQSWGRIPTSRPKSYLKAKILSSRPKSQPQGIWASRLGYGPWGWDMGLEVGGGGWRGRRRKFPCVKA